MSWKATAYVKTLEKGQVNRSEKLLMFVLADYHNTHRQEAWPSVAKLAIEALMSERQCRYCLRRLESKGVIANLGVDEKYGTSRYSFPKLDTDGGAIPAPLYPQGGAKTDPLGGQKPASPPLLVTQVQPPTWEREKLHLEMPILRWLAKAWSDSPITRKIKWPKILYPHQFKGQETRMGVVAYREAWLTHLKVEEDPSPFSFAREIEKGLAPTAKVPGYVTGFRKATANG